MNSSPLRSALYWSVASNGFPFFEVIPSTYTGCPSFRGGSYTPCLISIDKNTNELVAVRQENVYIPSEVKGIKLTADEINALKEGQPVYVDGMTSGWVKAVRLPGSAG